MKQYRNKILIVAVSFFAFLLWGRGLYLQQCIEKSNSAVSVRAVGDGVTMADIAQFRENEKSITKKERAYITVWNYLRNISVDSKEFDTSAKTGVYKINGAPEQTCSSRILYGSYPENGDVNRCAITKELSKKLFNTDNSIGRQICMNETYYSVSGVVSGSENNMFIQEKSETANYNGMELYFESDRDVYDSARKFLERYGLSESWSIVNAGLSVEIINFMGDFPAWFILGMILLFIVSAAWKRRTSGVQVTILLTAAVCTFVSFYLICGLKMHFPEELIPTRWSDFDFWADKYKNIRESARELEYLPHYPKDVEFYELKKMLIHFDIFAAIMLAISIILVKWCNEKKIYVGINKNYLQHFDENERGFNKVALSQNEWGVIGGYLVSEILAFSVLWKLGSYFRLSGSYLLCMPVFTVFLALYNILKNMLREGEDNEKE